MIQGTGLTLIKDMAAVEGSSLRNDSQPTWLEEKTKKAKKISKWIRRRIGFNMDLEDGLSSAKLYSDLLQEFSELSH